MHRSGHWILALVLGVACCSPALAQRDVRYNDSDSWNRDRNRDGNRDGSRDRWDWSRDRYRDYDQHRRPNYVFGKKAYLDRLSSDLYQQTNTICWEMYQYYQDNRDFRETYAEMYQIREATKRINDMVRDSYYRRHHDDDLIARDLWSMDKLFHHVQGDIRDWRANSRDAYRGGSLRTKMEICEDTMHQLMEDYGVKSKSDDHGSHH